VGGICVGKIEGRLDDGECVVLIVGRVDDGNTEDGRTVDVDIKLGHVVGVEVGNNIGTSDDFDELNKVGFVEGNDDGAKLSAIDGFALRTVVGVIEALADCSM